MSGQTAAIYEQTELLDLGNNATDDAFDKDHDSQISDPIASFLEKHGSTLIANHEGQMVPVAEAMVTCTPFAQMVAVMGERALSLVAMPRPKEETEEEVEELETEEETQKKEEPAEKTEAQSKQEDKKEVNQHKEAKVTQNKQEASSPAKATDFDSSLIIEAKSQSPENLAETIAEIKTEAPASTETDLTIPSRAEPSYIQEAVVSPTKSELSSAARMVTNGVNRVEAVLADREPVAPPADTEITAERLLKTEDIKEVAPTIQESSSLIEIVPLVELSAPADVQAAENKPQITLDTTFEVGENQEAESLNLETDYTQTADKDSPDEYRLNEALEDFTIPLPLEEKPLLVLREAEYVSFSTELNIPVKEVEETLEHLREKVEVLEADGAKAPNQILDRIKELPGELEISDEGKPMNEIEVRKELEVQFIELFDQVGIQYTSGLIEAFVELSLKSHFEEVEEAEAEAEVVNDVPQDRGTHEMIKKILAGITNLKKALVNAYLVGKSAMRLYTLDYAFTRA